jgi:DNA polymerase-3 subunit beta
VLVLKLNLEKRTLMKFSIARSELFEALNVVSKGMSARSTLPILSGILIHTADGTLTLQTTDLEISVKHRAPALIETEGQTVVPGKLLFDIVRSLPDAAVVMEKDGDLVSVRCQQSAFTMRTLNPADFPKFPEVEADKTITLPAQTISSMVRKVAKAVSRDETRAVLTGVLLVIEGAAVRLVATDSYRLSMVDRLLEAPVGEDLEVVIPGKALDEAMKLASPHESVRMGVSENQVVFDFGETTFVTRKVEGSFPNYRALIPKESETSVQVSTEEFLAAVKRVSLLAIHNTPLRLSVAIEDQTLGLTATTLDVGDASEDVMVKAEGKDVEIAFNHAFLVDGLTSVTNDEVTLEVQSALKPGLLSSTGDEDILYLLMPVRLG